MTTSDAGVSRRALLKAAAALPLAAALPVQAAAAAGSSVTQLRRTVPASGETIPVLGYGTSRIFNDADGAADDERLAPVLEVFFELGGAVIDTSPMYGNSEANVGRLLAQLPGAAGAFLATKVWTRGEAAGRAQMQRSADLLGAATIDLMQVHNLLDWRTQLATMRELREQGKLRLLGITTYGGNSHDELAAIMRSEALDFIQVSYSIANRRIEERLLPLAADRGIAVMANRPFQRGALFRRVKGQTLPPWTSDIGVESWGQFFLKFIIGHPGVTSVIPATSKVRHMRDNMQAGMGPLPDGAMREEMARWFQALPG